MLPIVRGLLGLSIVMMAVANRPSELEEQGIVEVSPPLAQQLQALDEITAGIEAPPPSRYISPNDSAQITPTDTRSGSRQQSRSHTPTLPALSQGLPALHEENEQAPHAFPSTFISPSPRIVCRDGDIFKKMYLSFTERGKSYRLHMGLYTDNFHYRAQLYDLCGRLQKRAVRSFLKEIQQQISIEQVEGRDGLRNRILWPSEFQSQDRRNFHFISCPPNHN